MLATFIALVLMSAVLAPSTQPAPTTSPAGEHAVFSSLSETPAGAAITFVRDGRSLTLPLDATAIVRERAIGGSWKDVTSADLRPGAPVTVFTHNGKIVQIDTLYAEVATRFVLVKNGYGVTPSGKIYRLVGRALESGSHLPEAAYVLLRTDPASDTAFDLIASRTPFAQAGANAPKVTVTVEVLVPVNTPPTDVIYMSTDAFSWTPNAIRMSPMPGNRWSVTLSLTGGTILKYKYTRGSWTTDERDQAGNEIANRSLTVPQKAGTLSVNDVVARWADRPS